MPIPRHRLVACAAVLGLTATLWLPAAALAGPDAAAHRERPALFPTTIALPDGFRPEGIAIGALPYAYFGSLADGAIYRANLVTGQGRVISPGPGTPSLGLALDHRGRLFVAGGTGGDARVVSATNGEVLASYPLATGEATFVNDVILTRDTAWFTDSFQPVLYRVPLGRRGRLPAPDEVTTMPLTGDFTQTQGQNANGIERTPDGTGLLVIQTSTQRLFRVDPATGATTEVDLAGQTLPAGDGLLLHGRTLYVVQNLLNQVSVVKLDQAGTRGTVVTQVSDPGFDLPTTIAAFGGRLYLPNFGPFEPTPDTPLHSGGHPPTLTRLP